MAKGSKKIARSVTFRPEVEQELQTYMRAKNLHNVSATINDLLDFALRPERRDEKNSDMAQLYHQLLFSLNAHRKKTARDLAVNQEIMLQFMLEYFKTNPAPLETEAGQGDMALKRLDKVLLHVSKNLGQIQAS